MGRNRVKMLLRHVSRTKIMTISQAIGIKLRIEHRTNTFLKIPETRNENTRIPVYYPVSNLSMDEGFCRIKGNIWQ